MKARLKLALGAAFAAVAVMAATQRSPEPSGRERHEPPCYSTSEVDLIMRANKWTREEATTILDMACKFSSDNEQVAKN